MGEGNPTFAMVLCRRPISSGSGGKEKFKRAVRDAASKYVSSAPMFADGSLYARVVWFYQEKTTQDVDNIAKRLFDALDGTVYSSDLQVVKCALEKVYYMVEAYELSDTGISNERYTELVGFLGQQVKDVLYVEVGLVTSRRIVFLSIDGGVA